MVGLDVPVKPLRGQILVTERMRPFLPYPTHIVRQTQEARNGDIVAVLAGHDESTDEATVKTFYREHGRVRLQPENASLEPIYAEHVQLLGGGAGRRRKGRSARMSSAAPTRMTG